MKKNSYYWLVIFTIVMAFAYFLSPTLQQSSPESSKQSNTVLFDLRSHEAEGGHLIAKHVGKTEDELKQRLAMDNITIASSFTNMTIAEDAVSAAVEQNQDKIQRYLNSSSPNYLVINYRHSTDVGVYVSRHKPYAISTNKVKVIIDRAPSMQHGYRIVTGYPTP